MMLGAGELNKLIGGGLIENHEPSSVGGAGYDLRVDRIYSIGSGSMLSEDERRTPKVSEMDFTQYRLGPGEYILCETLERINMPEDLAARVLNRSTLFRCGVSLFHALIDPGFHGTLTFGMKNLSAHEFLLGRHSRIAQIVFERVSGDTIGYDGRYQGGKIV
jgi:deoxycytidine triphosphate deaminase